MGSHNRYTQKCKDSTDNCVLLDEERSDAEPIDDTQNNNVKCTEKLSTPPQRLRKARGKRPRTLNSIGENIILQMEKSLTPQSQLGEVLRNYVIIKREKLKFEIAKLKFLNSSFNFEIELE